VARQLGVVPKHHQKQLLMDVSRWHKTNYFIRKQLRSLTSHGTIVILAQGPPWMRWACPKGACWACYQSSDANLLLALPFKVETLWGTQKGAKVLYPCILGACEILSGICDITKGSTWASPCYANPHVFSIQYVENVSSLWISSKV